MLRGMLTRSLRAPRETQVEVRRISWWIALRRTAIISRESRCGRPHAIICANGSFAAASFLRHFLLHPTRSSTLPKPCAT